MTSTSHIYLLVDESSSMSGVRRAADSAIATWLGGLWGQRDTVVSLGFFNSRSRWEFKGRRADDGPVPSVRIMPTGSTALRDTMLETVQDARNLLKYNPLDSVLVLVVTDGEDTASHRASPKVLREAITALLATGNADAAMLVPPGTRANVASWTGLDPENVREWETTDAGMREAEQVVQRSLQSYGQARSAGSKSVGRFFVAPDAPVAHALASAAVDVRHRVQVFGVHGAKATRIDSFAAVHTGGYAVGEWYYQLSKAETIQDHKGLLLHDKATGSWYTGPAVRALLSLPERGDVRVAPAPASQRVLYVQSTSTNRNLIPGTTVARLLGVPL